LSATPHIYRRCGRSSCRQPCRHLHFFARHDISHIELAVMMVMFALVLMLPAATSTDRSQRIFDCAIRAGYVIETTERQRNGDARSPGNCTGWKLGDRPCQKSYFCSSEALRVFGFDPEKDRPSLEPCWRAFTLKIGGWSTNIFRKLWLPRGARHRSSASDGRWHNKYVHELARSHVTLRGVRCE